MTDVDIKPPSEAEASRPTPVLMNDVRYQVLQRFYFEEASLLDDNALREWQAMLDPRLTYQMAVRSEFSLRSPPGGPPPQSYHLEDNYGSTDLRIRRYLDSPSVWSEDPPTRNRRFVSNLLVDETAQPDELAASTYLLVARNHSDDTTYEFISARRRDIVVLPEPYDQPRLLERSIIIDQLRLGLRNLALFL